MKASRRIQLNYALTKLTGTERALADARQNIDAWKTTIGTQIRQARKEAGVSLREMARRCDVSPAMLSDFECGRRWSDRLVAALVKELR